MIIGLFGLALVMIVGGVASVVQGFPYVRLETGLAMVIGGASAASAGAILLGLAATVARLKSLEQALESARPTAAVAFPTPPYESPIAQPSSEPLLAGAAGLSGVTVGADDRRVDGQDEHAVSLGVVDPVAVPMRESEPALPNLFPPTEPMRPEPSTAATPPERHEPHFDFADGGIREPTVSDRRPEQPDQLALRPAIEQTTTADPAPAVEPPRPEPEEAQVVGTYASGGNTYVMYSDGTIEADTPKGRFTFDSLDELKAFVAAGGESGARGAA